MSCEDDANDAFAIMMLDACWSPEAAVVCDDDNVLDPPPTFLQMERSNVNVRALERVEDIPLPANHVATFAPSHPPPPPPPLSFLDDEVNDVDSEESMTVGLITICVRFDADKLVR